MATTKALGGVLPELQDLESGNMTNNNYTDKSKIWDTVKKMDRSFGHTGSIFRFLNETKITNCRKF